jgi:hypothetical protein
MTPNSDGWWTVLDGKWAMFDTFARALEANPSHAPRLRKQGALEAYGASYQRAIDHLRRGIKGASEGSVSLDV